MTILQNQTVDDRSPLFHYEGIWFTDKGTWNGSKVGTTGTLASTNDLNATVTFTFPFAAVAFYYYGMRRSRGGYYGICVDCDPNNPNYVPIDAFDANDDGTNPPVVLYSQRFSEPGVHEIKIRNQADPRGTPTNNSELTLDRIDLEVVTSPVSTTTVTRTNTGDSFAAASTITLVPTPLTPDPDQTYLTPPSPYDKFNPTGRLSSPQSRPSSIPGYNPDPNHTAPSSAPSRVNTIIAGVVGSLAVLSLLVAFVYWRHMQRRLRRCDEREKQRARTPVDHQPPTPVPAKMSSAIEPGSLGRLSESWLPVHLSSSGDAARVPVAVETDVGSLHESESPPPQYSDIPRLSTSSGYTASSPTSLLSRDEPFRFQSHRGLAASNTYRYGSIQTRYTIHNHV